MAAPAAPSTPRLRSRSRRALLAALVLFALGLLPVLDAAHSHADDPGHGTCQLCQIGNQAYAAPAPADAPLPETVRPLPPAQAAPRPARGLPLRPASRGPPSA